MKSLTMRRIKQYFKWLNAPIIRPHSITCNYSNSRTSGFNNWSSNLTFPPVRNIHLSSTHASKIFVDTENIHAFSILPPLKMPEPVVGATNRVNTVEEFEQFLDQNWRNSSADGVVNGFETVRDFSTQHNLPLTDHRFDKLVDGLMDHCNELTDDQLLRLLHLLADFPQCEGLNSHNFHDVWTCLDDICCWKMGAWNMEKMFVFANAWNNLRMGGVSDYVYEILDKTGNKPQRFSKTVLLHAFFYMNVMRRKSIPFELEHVVARRIHEFTVDELAVIAMGYFKTRSRIKPKAILHAMIDAVKLNCESMNEISLTALLKAIRLTQNVESVEEVAAMLDTLTPHVAKLQTVTCVHVSLVGTGLQLKHAATLELCVQRVADDIANTRLKDIERTLLAAAMFDVDSCIYWRALDELHKASRRVEYVRHNRCLPCALNYLSQRKIYSYDLMNQFFDEEFIMENYGKRSKMLPRELLSLDACIDVECPDYGGKRLSPTARYKAVKWHLEYTPDRNSTFRLSFADKYYLDVVDHVVAVVGGSGFVRSDHVLPHFSKSDVIVCRSRASGEFVEPLGFHNYVLGDVKRPLQGDEYEWFAVMVLSPNQTVRNEVKALGAFLMKERQLRTIGYKPVLVFWSEFAHLSEAEKTTLIREKLLRA